MLSKIKRPVYKINSSSSKAAKKFSSLSQDINRKTLYTILEIDAKANSEEIKRAFTSKAKLYHPDRNTAPNSADLFKECLHAYEILKDPERRRSYDETLEYARSARSQSDSNSNNYQYQGYPHRRAKASQYANKRKHAAKDNYERMYEDSYKEYRQFHEESAKKSGGPRDSYYQHAGYQARKQPWWRRMKVHWFVGAALLYYLEFNKMFWDYSRKMQNNAVSAAFVDTTINERIVKSLEAEMEKKQFRIEIQENSGKISNGVKKKSFEAAKEASIFNADNYNKLGMEQGLLFKEIPVNNPQNISLKSYIKASAL